MNVNSQLRADKLRLLADEIKERKMFTEIKIEDKLYAVNGDKVVGPYKSSIKMCNDAVAVIETDNEAKLFVITPNSIDIIGDSKLNPEDRYRCTRDLVKNKGHEIIEKLMTYYNLTDLIEVIPFDSISQSMISLQVFDVENTLYKVHIRGYYKEECLGIINVKSKEWIIKGNFEYVLKLSKFISVKLKDGGYILQDYDGNKIVEDDIIGDIVSEVRDNLFQVRGSDGKVGLISIDNGEYNIVADYKYRLMVSREEYLFMLRVNESGKRVFDIHNIETNETIYDIDTRSDLSHLDFMIK